MGITFNFGLFISSKKSLYNHMRLNSEKILSFFDINISNCSNLKKKKISQNTYQPKKTSFKFFWEIQVYISNLKNTEKPNNYHWHLKYLMRADKPNVKRHKRFCVSCKNQHMHCCMYTSLNMFYQLTFDALLFILSHAFSQILMYSKPTFSFPLFKVFVIAKVYL